MELHVHILDDEKNIREALKMFMEMAGFKVTVSSNTKEAMTYFVKNEIDILITDYTHPGLNGGEFSKFILDTVGTKSILLTESAKTISKVFSDNIDYIDAILKPVNLEKLNTCIRKIEKSLAKENGIIEKKKNDSISLLLDSKISYGYSSLFEKIGFNVFYSQKLEKKIFRYLKLKEIYLLYAKLIEKNDIDFVLESTHGDKLSERDFLIIDIIKESKKSIPIIKAIDSSQFDCEIIKKAGFDGCWEGGIENLFEMMYLLRKEKKELLDRLYYPLNQIKTIVENLSKQKKNEINKIDRIEVHNNNSDKSSNKFFAEFFFPSEMVSKLCGQLFNIFKIPKRPHFEMTEADINLKKLLNVISPLQLGDGLTVRAFCIDYGMEGAGSVQIVPLDAKNIPLWALFASKYYRPHFGLYKNIMEVFHGNKSPKSYLIASILSRELNEFGAMQHACDWSFHSIIGETYWTKDKVRPTNELVELWKYQGLTDEKIFDLLKQTKNNFEIWEKQLDSFLKTKKGYSDEQIYLFYKSKRNLDYWKWEKHIPLNWEPKVQITDEEIFVKFYTYSGYGMEGIYLNIDRYNLINNYVCDTSRSIIAEGHTGFMV